MTNFKAAAMASVFVALLAFQSHQQKKMYKVEAPIEFWVQISNGIEFTKNTLKTSDLPSKTSTLINDSIFTPFQAEVSKQINAQIEAEKPKLEVKKDSTPKSKNN